MSDRSTIEWTDATWNPVRGCTKISPGCVHCLDPETLVLSADFVWKRLCEIKVGDVLVGFDEYVQNESGRGMRMLHPATVRAVWRIRQPAIRITTDKAEIICSADHRFLSYMSHRWVAAGNFRLGAQIRFIGCRIGSTKSDDYSAGYLMGMTDGDGTWRFTPGQRSDKLGYPQCYWRVALADEEGLVATQTHLHRFGLVAHIRPFAVNNGRGYRRSMQRLELRAIPDLTRLNEILNYRETADYGRGYLAGIFDAEGSFNGANLRIANRNQAYLDRVVGYAGRLGLDFRIEPKRPNEMLNARLYGPRRDRLAFFTLTLPAIKRKAHALFEASLDPELATVTRLEFIGEQELVDIETSTHTFYVNGLATHNCYAETFAERFRGVPGHPYEQGFDLRLVPEKLAEPLRWHTPKMVFVNSMSDLFHEDVPDDYILAVVRVMQLANWHTYQVLTKRSERMRDLLQTKLRLAADQPHIWWGVSVENRKHGLPRIDHLRAAPARIRFLSVEPLLEDLGPINLDGIRWVIVGGESGAGARPMKKAWVLAIRDQCYKAGVPFFFKQWGGVHKKQTGRKLDGKIYDEFPSRLELPVMETRRRLAAIAEIAALYCSPSTESESDLFSAQQ